LQFSCCSSITCGRLIPRGNSYTIASPVDHGVNEGRWISKYSDLKVEEMVLPDSIKNRIKENIKNKGLDNYLKELGYMIFN
jgi:DhnA family fructose-bisphosphate aldolase class Ia